MLLSSDILEVAIGLVFVYFIGSVIASHANEIFAGLVQRRSKQLETAIEELIQDDGFAKLLKMSPLITSLGSESSQAGWPVRIPAAFFKRLFDKNKTADDKHFPSYIPSSLFARALLTEIYSRYVRDTNQADSTIKLSANSITEVLNTLVQLSTALEPTDNLKRLADNLLNNLATPLRPDNTMEIMKALTLLDANPPTPFLKGFADTLLTKFINPLSVTNTAEIVKALTQLSSDPNIPPDLKRLGDTLLGNLASALSPQSVEPLVKTLTPLSSDPNIPDDLKGLANILLSYLASKHSPGSAAEIVKALTLLRDNAPTNQLRDLGRTLLTITSGVETNYYTAVGAIENWYDQKMERVTGAYKRWSQAWILIWALLIALVLNLDTINLVQSLWSNGALRHSIANQATNASSNLAPASGQMTTTTSLAPASGQMTTTTTVITTTVSPTISETKALLNDAGQAGLPIGWNPFINIKGTLEFGNLARYDWGAAFFAWLSKIAGLLISILAISMGAPFWFDLLNKLSNLRSSGLQPTSTTPTNPQPPAPPGGPTG